MQMHKQEGYTFSGVQKLTSYRRHRKCASTRPATAAASTRGCDVQRGRRLEVCGAERLLISVHHTIRGRHSKFKDVVVTFLVDVLEKYFSNNSGKRKVIRYIV